LTTFACVYDGEQGTKPVIEKAKKGSKVGRDGKRLRTHAPLKEDERAHLIARIGTCSGDSQFLSADLTKENLEDALAQALNSISNQATSNPDTSHRVPHPTSVTSRDTDPPHLNPSSLDSYEQAIFIDPSRREVAGHFYIDPESYPQQVYELRHSTGLITSPIWPTGLPETTVVTELSVQFISEVISTDTK